MNIDISVIIAAVGFLVALTNIFTEVVKKVTWDKVPTNILALIIAVALTVAAGVAYCQIKGMVIQWYIGVAIVVLGVLVAYAAMFGFDKLKEILHWNSDGGPGQ